MGYQQYLLARPVIVTSVSYAPNQAGPSGQPPYLRPGSVLWWHYRRADWAEGQPEHVHPMRVIADDARALVAWSPGGTPVLKAVCGASRDDGRKVPRDDWPIPGRVQGRHPWAGNGTLRIAPTGARWSAWLCWTIDGQFDEWFVNLEAPHRRLGNHLYTCDHVLDVIAEHEGAVRIKGAHDLQTAVERGYCTQQDAARVHADAEEVCRVIHEGGYPFASHWWSWRPDPSWPVPLLPPELLAS